LHFDASGTKSVNAYTFKPGSSHPSGKVRLHTTSPTDKASGDLNYSCLAIIGP
jgi:hypothetical protein